MTEISDVDLMAYADGVPTNEQMARVEQAVSEDESVKRRLENFQMTGASLSKAFSKVDPEVPNRFRQLIDEPGEKPNVIRLFGRQGAKGSGITLTQGFAIAATLVVGVLLGVGGYGVFGDGSSEDAVLQLRSGERFLRTSDKAIEKELPGNDAYLLGEETQTLFNVGANTVVGRALADWEDSGADEISYALEDGNSVRISGRPGDKTCADVGIISTLSGELSFAFRACKSDNGSWSAQPLE